MLAKLEQLANRLTEIDELLMQPDVASDQDNYRKLSKEHAELGPVVALYNDYVQVQADVDAAQEMLADPEMKEFAQEEISAAEGKMTAIEDDLQLMLLPKDPNDDKNIFLEIRAGTGGDESALFAADLLRMYSRFAEKNRWKVEIVSASESELGGYREVIVRLIGNDVYSRLKFESGGHRVQRVPVTETQGRIHTSACTVAVMPEADDVSDVHINPRISGSTLSALPVPVASISTRRIRRSGLPISRLGSWSSVRMIAASTRTRHRPCRFSLHASRTGRCRNSMRRRRLPARA